MSQLTDAFAPASQELDEDEPETDAGKTGTAAAAEG